MSSSSKRGALSRGTSPLLSFSLFLSSDAFSYLKASFSLISTIFYFFASSISFYYYTLSSLVNSVFSPFSLLFKISSSNFFYSISFY